MDIFESKIGTWRHPLVRHPTTQILSNFDALEISLAPKTVVWVALMLRTWKFEEMAQRTKVKTHFLLYSKKIRTHNHTISYILIQLVMHHRKQCFKVQRICIRWSDSVLCTWIRIPYAPAMSQHVSERFGWATMVLLTGVWSGRFDRFRPWTKLTVTLGNVEGLLLRPLFSSYLTRECWIMLNSTIPSQYLRFKGNLYHESLPFMLSSPLQLKLLVVFSSTS